MLPSSLPAQSSQRVGHGLLPGVVAVSLRLVLCRIHGLATAEGKKLGLVGVPMEAIPKHSASPSDSH